MQSLLLCSDEKGAQAITQVLGELGIPVERLPDPFAAVKKLMSQRFEVILVDSDNAQNATLVLTSARNSALNQASITVAIVDGKAGVPNAFRLGASMVLTKPVSLEQTRNTLRIALGKLKKGSAPKTVTSQEKTEAGTLMLASLAPSAKQEAQAATAAKPPNIDTASPLAKPASQAAPVEPDALPEKHAAQTLTGASSSSVVSFPKQEKPRVAPEMAATETSLGENEPLTTPGAPEDTSPARAASVPFGHLLDQPEPKKKKTGWLAAVAVLLIMAGLYAAWTTQPGFRSAAGSQSRALLARVEGFRTQPQPATPANPQTTPATHEARTTQPQVAQSPAVPASQPSIGNAPTANAGTSDASSSPNPTPTGNTQGDSSASSQAATSQNVKEDETENPASPGPSVVPASETLPRTNNIQPVMVPENVADDLLVYRVKPVYPKRARQMAVQGAVVLRTVVNKQGKVESARVLGGDSLLAPAALEAVKQWRYEPYRRHGHPVDFQTQVTVSFRLP